MSVQRGFFFEGGWEVGIPVVFGFCFSTSLFSPNAGLAWTRWPVDRPAPLLSKFFFSRGPKALAGRWK
jgi:hypothetical protein